MYWVLQYTMINLLDEIISNKLSKTNLINLFVVVTCNVVHTDSI